MTILDVREDQEPVYEIRFADRAVVGYRAFSIEREEDERGMYISDGVDSVTIDDAEHARNLIKAVEAAIKQGWVT